MAQFNNAMEVFKLLNKTNCRQCHKQTCLAFAGAVFQGQLSLKDCPFIKPEILEKHGGKNTGYQSRFEQDYLQELSRLKNAVKNTDLAERADVLGEKFHHDTITVKIFGKDFSVDSNGNISTILHVNSWLTLPVLHYILFGKGLMLTGKWVPFRELATSKDWIRFFEHQTVNQMKKTADANPSFFQDIIELFNGKAVENHYDADISLIIEPLPLLPILFCYNNPEEGMSSDLNLFFDTTADQNLPIEHIYTLVTGLGKMFSTIAATHGV